MELEVLKMQEKVNCEASSVWIYDEDSIYPFVCTGPKKDTMKTVILEIGEGLCGYSIEHNQEIISNNLADDKRWCSRVDEITGFKTRNIVCIPIVIDGDVYGCVELLNKIDGDFTQEDIEICRKIVEFMQDNI